MSAGTTFHTLVVNGKFDGVIALTTPIGSWRRIDSFTLLPATYSRSGISLCSQSGNVPAPRSTMSRTLARPNPICTICANPRGALGDHGLEDQKIKQMLRIYPELLLCALRLGL